MTIDALGCQTDIAQKIVDKDADYVLALKENQGNLYQDVVDLLTYAQQTQFRSLDSDQVRTVEKDHGRIEIRECWTLTDPHGFPDLRNTSAWADLRTLVMIRRERRLPDKTTLETAYYLSSLPKPAAPILEATRSHWGVENGLHWGLDLAFREDESRIRKANSPQNFAVLRHIALNLLKQELTTKLGIKAKRLKAAWSEAYLLKVLGIQMRLPCGPGQDLRCTQDTTKAHGRLETRTLSASADVKSYLDWPRAAQALRLERRVIRLSTGEISTEIVYGLTSLAPDQLDFPKCSFASVVTGALKTANTGFAM